MEVDAWLAWKIVRGDEAYFNCNGTVAFLIRLYYIENAMHPLQLPKVIVA